jgi:hypothetical protein
VFDGDGELGEIAVAETRRRSASVASSGTHTSLSVPAERSLASIAASKRSDFTRA